ncbi:MAG TPA: ribosome biogenesis GTPase YlqF [Candidatus Coproplasma avistercoris]|nr:ribosome biogenesis GTPase YlqF [Candidatus Coproplasma avistercoris]
MTRAMRMMGESAALCDGAVMVLDARCPASSFNVKLKKVFAGKPVLYVLNKSDLAENAAEWVKAIRAKGGAAVALNATASGCRRELFAACGEIVRDKRERAIAKGYERVFRFMVLGVPNTGKSTVINLLSGAKRTVTGNKAGVTRGKQWIRLEGFELLDTPGTMPPAFENQTFARRLAYVGSINDDILDFDDLALALLADMAQKYPDRLKARYGIADLSSPPAMLEGICVRRGLVLRGGGYDYERACRAVIDDLRKGRLGRVDLDDREDVLNTDF